MYELVKVKEKTYYINTLTRIGLYKLNEHDVLIIDSGNDKEIGRKILKILKENNWNLKTILNTHSHADHTGGNNFLQTRTNCEILSIDEEVHFINHPHLEASLLYGGFPPKDLRNKFLKATPSRAKKLDEKNLPKGIEMLRIDGHSYSQLAFKTDDDVWFLADGLISEATINKYHISFLYDVEKYIESLHIIENLSGELFIPSHAEPTKDIKPLVKANLLKVEEIISLLLNICSSPITFEDLLKKVFYTYSLKMDFNQNVLVGTTIRSYLSYMYDKNLVFPTFNDNKLYWQNI